MMSEEKQTTLTFEAAMAKLEQALHVLSQGEIPLEEAVAQYKIGLDMAAHCQKLLREAEGEIQILQNGVAEDFRMEVEAQ